MAKKKRVFSIPRIHQITIARATLKMPDPMVRAMGGMTKEQARDLLKGLRLRP